MLKIRLQRIGRKHEPHFRMVVVDSRQGPKSGKFVAKVGSYDAKGGNIQIDAELAKKYLSTGAQPTITVHNMLVSKGIIEGAKKNALPKKTPIIKEAPAAPEPAPVASAPVQEASAETEASAEEVAESAPAVEETPAEA